MVTTESRVRGCSGEMRSVCMHGRTKNSNIGEKQIIFCRLLCIRVPAKKILITTEAKVNDKLFTARGAVCDSGKEGGLNIYVLFGGSARKEKVGNVFRFGFTQLLPR